MDDGEKGGREQGEGESIPLAIVKPDKEKMLRKCMAEIRDDRKAL